MKHNVYTVEDGNAAWKHRDQPWDDNETPVAKLQLLVDSLAKDEQVVTVTPYMSGFLVLTRRG